MPTAVGILAFMSIKNFMLSQVEYENSCITSSLVKQVGANNKTYPPSATILNLLTSPLTVETGIYQ